MTATTGAYCTFDDIVNGIPGYACDHLVDITTAQSDTASIAIMNLINNVDKILKDMKIGPNKSKRLE